MPLYDYVCTACGTRIEVMHGVNDAGPGLCSACGGTLRRALSAPAIVFKGSGWAKKDARSAAPSKGGKPDGAAADKASRPDDKPAGPGKTDSKPSESTAG